MLISIMIFTSLTGNKTGPTDLWSKEYTPSGPTSNYLDWSKWIGPRNTLTQKLQLLKQSLTDIRSALTYAAVQIYPIFKSTKLTEKKLICVHRTSCGVRRYSIDYSLCCIVQYIGVGDF